MISTQRVLHELAYYAEEIDDKQMKQKSKLSQNSLKAMILMSIEYRMNQSFYNLC